MILSCYSIEPTKPAANENRVWIVTKADRSVATILLRPNTE
jgi:hypothetical protein